MNAKGMMTVILAGAALAAMPSTAGAVTSFSFDGTNGTFADSTPGPNTRFLDTFTFTVPTSGTLSLNWETIYTGILTNLKGIVTVNGTVINGTDTPNAAGGFDKIRSVMDLPVAAGLVEIVVHGSAMVRSSFAGSFTFAAAGVPEPAAWSLMILGMGGVGFAMRRRQRANVKVSFA